MQELKKRTGVDAPVLETFDTARLQEYFQQSAPPPQTRLSYNAGLYLLGGAAFFLVMGMHQPGFPLLGMACFCGAQTEKGVLQNETLRQTILVAHASTGTARPDIS